MNTLAGIDPKTRVCVLVGLNDNETALEIIRLGCIAVPVTKETALELWGSEVQDIYAIAARRP